MEAPALDPWKLYVDGASNSRGSSVGIVILAPIGGLIEQCVHLAFQATNNVTEYETLLLTPRKLQLLEAKKVLVHSYSCQVVNQLNNAFEANEEHMKIIITRGKESNLGI